MIRQHIIKIRAIKLTIAYLLIAIILASCSALSSKNASTSYYFPHATRLPLILLSEKKVSSRLLDLKFKTPALESDPHVYVLLPSNYYKDPTRRYPVIYLLHGGSAGPNTGTEYQQWVNYGDVVNLTKKLDVICVMPQGDSGGWYTNWYNNGKGGPPMWETFHVRQLVPYIDTHFRTFPTYSERAIVGLSMGGYGAMEYAAKFPDVFGTVASFSGAVDIVEPPYYVGPLATLIIGIMAKGNGGSPDGPFGNFNKNLIVWENHDPADLVDNLRNTNIYLYTGNGTPGPLDNKYTVTDFTEEIENIVDQSTFAFAYILSQHHISYYADFYGNGTHSWPYWTRDLREVLPKIMYDFSHPKPYPKVITYKSADSTYSSFGWHVTIKRKVQEFSVLKDASKHGFFISGSGTAIIKTPDFYKPFEKIQVTIINFSDNHASQKEILQTNNYGDLTIRVKLGPSNTENEFTDGYVTKIYTANVQIN